MDGVQETVFMAVLSDDQLVYIAKSITTGQSEQPHSPARANRFIAPGLARHFGIHAGGQKGRAARPHGVYPVYRAYHHCQRRAGKAAADILEQGYAVDNEENEEGLFCLAAPVYGPDGVMKAAISTAGPKERMLARKAVIVEQLLHTAGKITESIGGYRKPL